MPTEVQLQLWMSVALFIFSCFNFYKARAKDSREETKNETEGVIKTNLKLDQLCSNMNETRIDIRGLIDTTRKVSEEQIRIAQEVKAMWRKVDEHTEKLETLYRHVNIYGEKE